MSPVPEPSACTCSSARESFTFARGPSCVPPEYVMSSSCQPVDGSVMRCPLDVQRIQGRYGPRKHIAPGALSRGLIGPTCERAHQADLRCRLCDADSRSYPVAMGGWRSLLSGAEMTPGRALFAWSPAGSAQWSAV